MARGPSGAALEGHKKLIELARGARLLVWCVATAITIGFAWVQLQNSDLTALVRFLGADLIWRVSLILYFTSWVMGCQFDIDLQEEVLTSSGERTTLKWEVLAFILGITILGIVLVWAVGDLARFSAVLTIFLVVDHGAWRYLAKFMGRPYEVSARHYEAMKDKICLEKLATVRALVFGGWKWWRLTVVVPIVLIMLADAFIPQVRNGLSGLARTILGGGQDAEAVVGGILVFAFVFSAELWIWLMRIRARTRITVLDDLGHRYELRPIKAAAAAKPEAARS
jgi:hypothetical protein